MCERGPLDFARVLRYRCNGMGSIELSKAYAEAIADLKALPPPIVRLSGPLRTGGDGYEVNQRRFKTGEALLRSRGLTVYGYEKFKEVIQANYDLHFEHFNIPILQSGLIRSIFFLPGWETSGGASYERKLCGELNITAEDLTRDELSAYESRFQA